MSANLHHELKIINTKAIAFSEGLAMLEDTHAELVRTAGQARLMGIGVVMARACMVPANVVINAGELKKASSMLQHVTQALAVELHARFGKGRGPFDNSALDRLWGIARKAAIDGLKAGGQADLIPVVNIFAGLAEDAMALMRAMNMRDATDRELTGALSHVELQLQLAKRALSALGIARAGIYDRAALKMRTA